MKKALFAISALALTSFVSCNKTEVNTAAPSVDPNEITVSMSSLDVATKTPYDGTISSINPLVARVLASQTSEDYTTEYQGSTNGYIKFTDESTAVGFTSQDGSEKNPKFYPATANAEIFLFGLYPNTTTWTTNTKGSATATFTGCEDIMVAPETSSIKSTSNGNLGFTHKLTQLIVKFEVEDANAKNGWGTITDLTLSGINTASGAAKPANSITVTTTDSPTVSFTGNADTPFYGCSKTSDNYSFTNTKFTATDLSDITVGSGNGKVVAYTLCQPIDAANISTTADYKITVKNANTSREVSVDLKSDDNSTSFTESTEGYAFTITLNFKATEILATASVTDWKDGGSTTVDVE